MNQAFEIAGVGLSTQQKALDTIANNVANMGTPGYKRSVLKFSEVMASPGDPSHPGANLSTRPSLVGVRADAVADIESQGEITKTGNPLDVAIEGKGFIELMAPGGRTLLWRGGTLIVRDGVLASADGFALRSQISVPQDATEIHIDSGGAVTAGTTGDVRDIGKISIVRVDDPTRLERLDGGVYQLPDDMRLSESNPGEDGAGLLVQGGMEQSNVQLNEEMIQLMMVQRAYAANSQIVQAADQLAGIANNLKE